MDDNQSVQGCEGLSLEVALGRSYPPGIEPVKIFFASIFADRSSLDDVDLVSALRALKSVRNAEGELMACLEVHARSDISRNLRETEVNRELR